MANILVLEDIHALRRQLVFALTQAGHTVAESNSGEISRNPATFRNVDVMITDIIMPDTDGIEAICHARKAKPDLKIITMSGGGEYLKGDYLPLSLKLGASEYMRKPFEPDAMLACVKKVLAA